MNKEQSADDPPQMDLIHVKAMLSNTISYELP